LDNLFFLLILTGLGVLTAYYANTRGRDPYLWFAVGFFFGILGFIALFLFPNLNPPPVEKPKVEEPEPSFVPNPFECQDWYYLNAEKKNIGPLTLTELKDSWKEGSLDSKSYVWNDTFEDWKKVVEVEGLIKELGESKTPSPKESVETTS